MTCPNEDSRRFVWRTFVAHGDRVPPRTVTASELPPWLAELIAAQPGLNRIDWAEDAPHGHYHIIERA